VAELDRSAENGRKEDGDAKAESDLTHGVRSSSFLSDHRSGLKHSGAILGNRRRDGS
jgi:hypothetical protein